MSYPNHRGQKLETTFIRVADNLIEVKEENREKFEAIDEFLNSLATLIDDLRRQL